MTDKVALIKAEIESRIQECKDSKIDSSYYDGLIFAFEEVRDFINSLPEEPIDEDLEEAAIEICSKVLAGETIVIDGYEYVVLSDAEECFKAGSQWQKQKDAITWSDVHELAIIEDKLIHEWSLSDKSLPHTEEFFKEVLKRFNEHKKSTT